MYLFGPTNEERGSHFPSSTTATPFTFTFTQIQTSDSETAPFLKLPAELRNKIYELAAKQQERLILFDCRIVLPPLGSVCKKIRTEMRGIFEHEAISNTILGITALVVNFDFKPLFNWLDEYDQRPNPAGPGCFVRTLDIHVARRPELSLGPWFDENSPRYSTRGDSLKKQCVQHLLLRNLMLTMTGWSWELSMFFLGFPRSTSASPHRYTQSPRFHTHPRCRRIKSGYHYNVTIMANNTWRCLDNTPSTMSQVSIPQNKSAIRDPDTSITNLYTGIYDALVCDESMRSDVDRRLALAVREACRSHFTRAERDAAALFTDMSHLKMSFTRRSLSATLCWKWSFIIHDRAAKELARLEADLRVVRQKRHELLMTRGVEKRPQTNDSGRRALKRRRSRSGLDFYDTEDEFEELIWMMWRWHR